MLGSRALAVQNKLMGGGQAPEVSVAGPFGRIFLHGVEFQKHSSLLTHVEPPCPSADQLAISRNTALFWGHHAEPWRG